MNRYSVADARKRISSVLDKAEQGEGVLIERRGVLFRLTIDKSERLPPRPAPTEIEILDADVESGQWTWDSRGNLGKKLPSPSKRRTKR
ncbi:MAG: hypothetical protein SF187_22025 [Deltaproteobacteria bacterium]|nr:hypothetical protein [Deltaproteobacteria bacterium]